MLSPSSGGQNRSRFLLSLSEDLYRWVLIWSQPALSLPSAATRAGRSDRRNDYGPSIPSAVLNHTVPSMVTSPLTNAKSGGAFGQECGLPVTISEKSDGRTNPWNWCGAPLDNGSAGTYLHISRGLLAALAGLNATARSFRTEAGLARVFSRDASTVVDSRWGICFHRGFGSGAHASRPPAL